jgi:hypothetical protein
LILVGGKRRVLEEEQRFIEVTVLLIDSRVIDPLGQRSGRTDRGVALETAP